MHPNKILILGHGRHGKDTLAEIICRMYNLSFISSSHAALEVAVMPALRAANLEYVNLEAAYADRINHRELWKKAISDYNSPDKSALARKILEHSDIYVGMRCEHEFTASRRLFDAVLWVHRPNTPDDPTMTIPFDGKTMYPVFNIGPVSNMEAQVRCLMQGHF